MRKKYLTKEEKAEAHRLTNARWHERNKDKILKTNREQYTKGRDKIRAKQKIYYDSNIETIMNRKDKNYIANREVAMAYAKKHRETLQARLSTVRARAKKRALEYNLDMEWLEALKKVCSYTGLDLTLEANKSNTLSFDRVDSSRGYTKDNTVLCCWRVNQMKNNMAVGEMLEFAEKIVAHRSKK